MTVRIKKLGILYHRACSQVMVLLKTAPSLMPGRARLKACVPPSLKLVLTQCGSVFDRRSLMMIQVFPAVLYDRQ